MYHGKINLGVRSVTVFRADRDALVIDLSRCEKFTGHDAELMQSDDTSAAKVVMPKPSRLWIWVLAAFVLQLGVWTAWIILASHHKVEEVPLDGGSSTKTSP